MKQIEYNGVVFKVGGTVSIYRRIESNAVGGMGPLGNWCNVWVDQMDELVGKKAVIYDIRHIGVRFHGSSYSYPLAALVPNPETPLLPVPSKVSTAPFELAPFMRAVTRNGWQFIVASHEAVRESPSPYAPLFLVQRGGMQCPIMWPGEQKSLEGTLEIVEVYAPGEYINEILREDKRGELLWTETMDAEKAKKAALVARLQQQQRADIDARINELGAQ